MQATFFDFSDEFQNQSYISKGLKEYACWLSLDFSYEKTEILLDRQIHPAILSSQKIRDLVVDKAIQISNNQAQQVKEHLNKSMPRIASKVNIYQKKNAELLIFDF